MSYWQDKTECGEFSRNGSIQRLGNLKILLSMRKISKLEIIFDWVSSSGVRPSKRYFTFLWMSTAAFAAGSWSRVFFDRTHSRKPSFDDWLPFLCHVNIVLIFIFIFFILTVKSVSIVHSFCSNIISIQFCWNEHHMRVYRGLLKLYLCVIFWTNQCIFLKNLRKVAEFLARDCLMAEQTLPESLVLPLWCLILSIGVLL